MATLHKFTTFGRGINGIEWRWVNYFTTAADFTPNQTQMVAWITAAWATVSATISSGFTIYGIGYSPYLGSAPYTDPKGWGATLVYNVNLTGGNATEALPSQTSMVIFGRTNTKHVVARKNIPGITEAGQANGIPTSTTLTNMGNLGGFMYASTYDMGGTPLTPGAWGKRHGFTPTQTTSNSPYLGSQRRRKPGVGI